MNKAVLSLDKNYFKIIPGLLSMSAIFLPRALNPTIFRTSRSPLEIHSNQSAPPKSAFESIIGVPSKQEIEWKEIENKKSINLNSTMNENPNWNPIAELRHKKMVFPEMHISSSKMQADSSTDMSGESLAAGDRDLSWIEGLTPAQRDRVQEAQFKNQVLDQNWKIPSLRETVSEKVDEINQSMRGFTPTSVSTKVYVSATRPNGEVAHSTVPNNNDMSVMMLDPSAKLQKIKGTLSLAPGLALGDRTLEVRRFVEGVPQNEIGRVDIQTGSFEIDIEETQGSIVAEMYEKSGAIVASGALNISEMSATAKPEIVVVQKNQFAGNLVNFNRTPERLITSKMNSFKGESAEVLYATLGLTDKTDVLGSFSFAKISDSSWGIVRAKSKKFRESLFLLGAGEGQNLSMMPETLISALENLTSDEASARVAGNHGGVVWGQVLFDGKPLSGISIAIEMDEEAAPIYMEGFIPNKSLAATTENGYFVFTDLAPGFYSLIAKRNGEYFGHLNVVVDENTVTVGNIESTTKQRTTLIKVYDAFEGVPMSAQVQLQSLRESIQVHGIFNTQQPLLHRLSLGQVQPDMSEYAPTRIHYSDNDEYIHIPLVRLSWLDDLSQRAKISQMPNTGVLVGFVPEDAFEAYLTHEDQYSNTNIIYFDHAGNQSTSGVAGGGFVMFNVPPGTQSIVVMSKKTEMLSTIVLPIDEKSISTAKFRF